MTRKWMAVAALAAAILPAAYSQARKGAAPWRNNVNLPGGDFLSIDMNTSDPSGCKAACEREGRCKAWTFVKPDENGNASCWLKDTVPDPSREDCCVSGYKGDVGGSPGATARWRNNVNLPGGDYRSIDMETSDPSGCKAACEREGRCKAWTFVKPDESGRGYCWLKDSVPEATRENCCVSALKGEGVAGGRRY